MHFSHSFLMFVAREHKLSRTELTVFLLRFQENLDYDAIAQRLEIEKAATFKRMGQVYRKIGIGGSVKGKETELINFLYKKQEEFNRRRLDWPADENAIDEDELQSIQHQLNSLREEIIWLKSRSISVNSIEQVVEVSGEQDDPVVFIDLLLTQLEQGNPVQGILEALASVLPKLIERKAAETEECDAKNLAFSFLSLSKKFFLKLDCKLPEVVVNQLDQDDSIDTLSL